jgi:hypothetical protein
MDLDFIQFPLWEARVGLERQLHGGGQKIEKVLSFHVLAGKQNPTDIKRRNVFELVDPDLQS